VNALVSIIKRHYATSDHRVHQGWSVVPGLVPLLRGGTYLNGPERA
jgi:hypothetical protein